MVISTSVRTKLVITGGFLALTAGLLAVLWFSGANPKSVEQQCADKCRASGRGHELIAKRVPMTAHGERAVECACR